MGQVWEAGSGSTVSISACVNCPLGRADVDSSSLTPCSNCTVGQYGDGVTCAVGGDTGLFDGDQDPSTPCTAFTICYQNCSAGYHDDDCDTNTPCVTCPAGEYTAGGIAPQASCAS